MLIYTLKRLLQAIPTMLVVITISFFLMRVAPGGPFDGERNLPPEIEANLMAAYHLDEPLPMQYLRYMGNLLQGDFGPSFKYKDFSVTELIAQGLPGELEIGGLAILLALLVGLPLGIAAALRRNSADRLYGHERGAGRHRGTQLRHRADPGAGLGVLLAWLPAGGWNGGRCPTWCCR